METSEERGDKTMERKVRLGSVADGMSDAPDVEGSAKTVLCDI